MKPDGQLPVVIGSPAPHVVVRIHRTRVLPPDRQQYPLGPVATTREKGQPHQQGNAPQEKQQDPGSVVDDSFHRAGLRRPEWRSPALLGAAVASSRNPVTNTIDLIIRAPYFGQSNMDAAQQGGSDWRVPHGLATTDPPRFCPQ